MQSPQIQPMSQSQPARTKFIEPGALMEGTITSVSLDSDPFHCTLQVTPTNPDLIAAEGRYSDNQLSLGKLRRNLVHLQFQIKDLEDILSAVESLEGRQCLFRIDKSGWISWIQKLITREEPPPTSVPTIVSAPKQVREIFFVKLLGYRSIFEMKDADGHVWGFAVGPTGLSMSSPHGWVLDLNSLEEAQEVLRQRKQI